MIEIKLNWDIGIFIDFTSLIYIHQKKANLGHNIRTSNLIRVQEDTDTGPTRTPKEELQFEIPSRLGFVVWD